MCYTQNRILKVVTNNSLGATGLIRLKILIHCNVPVRTVKNENARKRVHRRIIFGMLKDLSVDISKKRNVFVHGRTFQLLPSHYVIFYAKITPFKGSTHFRTSHCS